MRDDFADEVDGGIRQKFSTPLDWRAVKDEVRRFPVSRFPSGIDDTILADVVVIQAVKHLPRDPDHWPQRRT